MVSMKHFKRWFTCSIFEASGHPKRQEWTYRLLVLVVMLAAYGWQITSRGFYWDDWLFVFLHGFQSPAHFWTAYLSDRPVSVWTFLITMPFLGISPLRWQLFSLLVRWLGVLIFISALKRIWPAQTWTIRWTGLFLAVFPGFTQQSISVAYSQHFLTFLLYAVSLWLMAAAVEARRNNRLLTILAVFCSLLQIATMEYFIGLELLRPLFLWVIFHRHSIGNRLALKKTLLTWLPYGAILVLFIVFRLGILPRFMPAEDPNAPVLLFLFIKEPFTALMKFAQLAVQDGIYASIFAWTNTIDPRGMNFQSRILYFSLGVGAVVAVLAALAMIRLDHAEGSSGNRDSSRLEIFLAGTLGILLGGVPVWVTARSAIAGSYSDRFFLAMMVGVVLTTMAALDWLSASKRRMALVLVAPLGLAIAFHLQIMHKYHTTWEVQRNYYWQLAWRIPSIQPQTAILAPEIPLSYVATSSLGFAYNVIFDPTPDSFNLPYWFFSAPRQWSLDDLPAIATGTPVFYRDRNITFQADSRQSIAVQYNPARGCVRVLSPRYLDAPPLSDGLVSEYERSLAGLTGLDRIQAEERQNHTGLEQIFGNEPFHDWCYFFEKADLAAQFGKWEKVISLDGEATHQGFKPLNGTEYIPFIEAYAFTGDGSKALELTLTAYRQQEASRQVLCAAWKRIEEQSTLSGKFQDQVVAELKCSPAAP